MNICLLLFVPQDVDEFYNTQRQFAMEYSKAIKEASLVSEVADFHN